MDGMIGAFALPPENMLSEQITLPDHHMALGLQHLDGAGLRVVIWDGEKLRHMSRAAAHRFARALDTDENAAEYKPVIEALDLLASRIEAIEAEIMARKSVETVH